MLAGLDVGPEAEYFGLYFLQRTPRTWLDLHDGITKQNTSGKKNKTVLLQFGVKFYVSHPNKIVHPDAQWYCFRQIHEDMMAGTFVCHEEEARLQLCAHAAQAMLDDYTPATHQADYLVKGGIVPRFAGSDAAVGPGGFSARHAVHYGRAAQDEIRTHHAALKGVPPFNAMFQFLLLACQQDSYGADCFEGTRKGKPVLVGVNCHGVRIFPRDHWGSSSNRLATYLWPEIKHISYRGKTFTVVKRAQQRGDAPKDNIKASCKAICQAMWSSAVRRHTFHRRRRVPIGGTHSPFKRAIGYSAESPMRHSRMSGRTELEVMRAASVQSRAHIARSPYGRPHLQSGGSAAHSPLPPLPAAQAAPKREGISTPPTAQAAVNDKAMAGRSPAPAPPLARRSFQSNGLTAFDAASEFGGIDKNKASPDELPGSVAALAYANRYRDVLPNGHSRVKLQQIGPDVLTTYINANHLRSWDGKAGWYIAAQGPKPETIVDFWRMVWENSTEAVVMTTGITEGGRVKCAQYWPNEVSDAPHEYQNFKVQTMAKKRVGQYLISELDITYSNPKSTPQTRRIAHFWYDSWPDHGAPKVTKPVTDMLTAVKARSAGGSAHPWVVHCSAGIGRTGTFIGIDMGMQQINSTGTTSVRDLISAMRADRGGSVQTVVQAAFMQTALDTYTEQVNTTSSGPDETAGGGAGADVGADAGADAGAGEDEDVLPLPPPPKNNGTDMSDWMDGWDDTGDLRANNQRATSPEVDLPPSPLHSPGSNAPSPPPMAQFEESFLGTKSLDGTSEQLVGHHVRALFSFDGVNVSTYAGEEALVTSQNIDTVKFSAGTVFLYINLEASNLGHLDNSSDWWVVKDARSPGKFVRIPSLVHCRRLGLADPFEAVELVQPGDHAARPIVFLGPLREEVNDLLLAETEDMGKYRKCVPYTSRPMRDDEIAGVNYNFISDQHIQRMVADGDFIEHLEDKGHVYGTTYDSIRSAVCEGHLCTLILHNPTDPARILQTLELIGRRGYGPVVIYLNAIDATTLSIITESDPIEAQQLYTSGQQLMRQCSHAFTSVLECGTDRESILTDVERIIDREAPKRFWAPVRSILQEGHPLLDHAVPAAAAAAVATKAAAAATQPAVKAKPAMPATKPKPPMSKPKAAGLSLEDELKRSVSRRNSRMGDQAADADESADGSTAFAEIQARVQGRGADIDSDEDGHQTLEAELASFMHDETGARDQATPTITRLGEPSPQDRPAYVRPEMVANVVTIETSTADSDHLDSAGADGAEDFDATEQALALHDEPTHATLNEFDQTTSALTGHATSSKASHRVSSFGLPDSDSDDDGGAPPPPPPSHTYSPHVASSDGVGRPGLESRRESRFSSFGVDDDDDGEGEGDVGFPGDAQHASASASPVSPAHSTTSRPVSTTEPSPSGSSVSGRARTSPRPESVIVVGAMYDTETIELIRGPEGYGFKFKGGTDKLIKLNGDSSIYVTDVAPGGTADRDGRLQPGDRIIEAGGVSFIKVTHETVVKTIRSNREKIALTVTRTDDSLQPGEDAKVQPKAGATAAEWSSVTAEEDIEFRKNLKTGLGFGVLGGAQSERHRQEGDNSIYIGKILPAGAAALDGRLQEGDRIIKANGMSFMGVTRAFAIKTLKSNTTGVRLTISRNCRRVVLASVNGKYGLNIRGGKEVGSTGIDNSPVEIASIQPQSVSSVHI